MGILEKYMEIEGASSTVGTRLLKGKYGVEDMDIENQTQELCRLGPHATVLDICIRETITIG